MLPLEEFKVLDTNAEELGVPVSSLMEMAGRGLAEFILEESSPEDRILFLCGTGNNGGDCFVAARQLKGDRFVRIALAKSPADIRSALCREKFEIIRPLLLNNDELDISEFDVVVDGLLGTGFEGEVREPYRTLIQRLQPFRGNIFSVDLPSGFQSELAVMPNATITFHDIKEGMNEDNCGRIVIKDIGIPPRVTQYVHRGECHLYPRPKPHSHKGQNGRLLIIGGGPYTGAPSLAGISACRIGVDLLHIATPARSFLPVSCYSPLFITHQLDGDSLGVSNVKQLETLMNYVDCLLIGPGLGHKDGTLKAVAKIVEDCAKSLVLDADALRIFDPKFLTDLSLIPTVVTPHVREFERMSGQEFPPDLEGRMESVHTFAAEKNITVLLKGETDIISNGVRIKLNDTGNPSMTTGGTGDVLAGIVAGLLSKGMKPFDAARLGAYINGCAGDLAFRKKSYGLTAEDVSECIPSVLRAKMRGL